MLVSSRKSPERVIGLRLTGFCIIHVLCISRTDDAKRIEKSFDAPFSLSPMSMRCTSVQGCIAVNFT